MGRRLLAGYLSLALLVLAVLEIPLAVSYGRNARRDLTTRVERDAVALASLAEDTLEGSADRAARVAAVARDYTRDTGGRVVVVDAAGRALVDTEGAAGRTFATRPEFGEALAGRVATGERASATLGTDLLYVAVPVASSGTVHGAVRITYPTSEVDGRVHRYWLILAGIAAVVLAAAAVVGVRFARSTATPLRRLEQAAVAAGGGDLAVRAPDGEGPPEVRSLARSFNEMVGRLDRLMGAQQAFVADASHQLRTPLAALRLRLDNLAAELGPGGGERIAAATAEVERLSALVDGLLALARADRPGAARRAVDVHRLVAERASAWSDLAVERGVRIDAAAPVGVVAWGTPGALEQALDNLLDNALEAAPSGSAVRVTAGREGDLVAVHVVDAGPGMTPEQREHATDRFWRAPGAPAGGSGLGLAIVRRLAEADGGRLELRDAPGGGLDAVVLAPAPPPGR